MVLNEVNNDDVMEFEEVVEDIISSPPIVEFCINYEDMKMQKTCNEHR